MDALKKHTGNHPNYRIMPGIFTLRIPGGTRLLMALLLSCLFGVLPAQDTLEVKGIVRNPLHEPVANASVSVAGSLRMPVVTNDSGEFTLTASPNSDWIIVAAAGTYKPKKVFLNGKANPVIVLTPLDLASGDDPVSVLSEPIVRRNIVPAYSELPVKNMHHTPILTVDQYLQGRVTGVNAVNRSGMPGSGAYVTIRGLKSINTSSQPLYVVDGIQVTPHGLFGSNLEGFSYNPLLELNPFDVTKTVVIKDPAVTAAYGTKASNGVVLIETLDPSVTQTTIELDLRSGLSLAPPRYIPQMDAHQHKTLMQEVLFSSGKPEEVIREDYPSLYLTPEDDRFIDYQHNTNWQELIFHNTFFNNLNLNVKGGDEIARYGLSFGLINNRGTIKTTSFTGYNLRFVSRLNIFAWLKMDAGVSLNYNTAHLKEAASVKETSPIMTSLAKSPMLNPYKYDILGNRLTTLAEVDELGTSNPLATIQNYDAKNTNYSFISSLGFKASFNRDLSFNTKFNLVYNVMKEQIFMPNHGMEHYYNLEAINVAKATNNDLKSFFNNTYLSYNKTLGTDHVFSSVTGMNLQTNKFENDWGLTKNAHENDQYRNLQDGLANLREIGGQNRAWNWLSFYESVNYAYRDKYLVTATVSLDGSSRLGDQAAGALFLNDIPFGLFYAGGVAWRVSNESFLKNFSWLEELKLRLSAGKSGNDDIGESSATNYYQAAKFRETVGFFPALLPNTGLTFESVVQYNAGVDISLLGNRISFTGDLYRSNTDDMLIFKPVNAYFGYDVRMENAGTMKNSGWELGLFARIKDNGTFRWDIQANLSASRNEITGIDGDKLVTPVTGAEIVNMVGAPANSFYGYVYEGVFADASEATAAMLVNDRGIAFHAGDARFKDLSGPAGTPDGVINGYDKTAIGSSMPSLTGGLTTSLTYGKFTLNMALQFVRGNEVFNYLRYKNERMTGLENQSRVVLNRWQYDGQATDIPRALWNDPVGNSSFSTRWIEDGSYARLKNLSLSYKIPDKFLTFRYAEFYVSVNNLITLTRYLGYDPEFSYSFSSLTQGIDYGLMPQARQFMAGIKVGL